MRSTSTTIGINMTTDSEKDDSIIQYLKVYCKGASFQPTLNGQNEPSTLLVAQDVDVFELINEIVNNIGVNGILGRLAAADIANYQKGGDNE